MNKRFSSLLIALVMGLLIVAIGLGFLFGASNPVPWILIGVLILIPFVYKRRSESDKLVWKDAYSVGIKMFDDDHKKLIELLNKFQTAYDYHTGEEYERAALRELVDYTRYHFEREEKVMEEQDYPDLEAHKEQHREMIEKVAGFMQSYEAQGHEALEGVAHYLKGWLINHISGTDRQYGPYLTERGVS